MLLRQNSPHAAWAALLLLWSGGAWAEDAEGGEERQEETALLDKAKSAFNTSDPEKMFALTLSGGLSETFMVEVQGELNLGRPHSVAVVLGAGAWPGTAGSGWAPRVRAGAQYRLTYLGDFDTGIYVGAEGLFDIAPASFGTAWSVKPSLLVVGAKYTAPVGLVVDFSAGPAVAVSNYSAVRFTGTLNLNVGWAFGMRDPAAAKLQDAEPAAEE